MNFIETRGNDGRRPSSVSFSQAILGPMSSFGGIYVPEGLPALGESFLRAHLSSDYKTLARAVLAAFALDIDQAVIDRAVNRHASFGLGVHRCLGSNLARMELRVGLEEWLRAFPSFRLDETRPVHWYGGQVRSISTLPLLLDDGGAAAPGDAG